MKLDDDSGVVLTWLVKVLFFLSALGLIVYEIGAVTVNFLGLDASADDIAVRLSSATQQEPKNEAQLKERAKVLAKDIGARLVRLKLKPRDHTLTIVLTRRAPTLVIDKIPPLEGWAKATVSGKSGTE
jgi:hypothetical protein